MSMTAEYSVGVAPYKGRLLFTPERVEQIRNLRERGKSVEEIAEIIGCTVGTLRVRCSEYGISLRYATPTIMQKKPTRAKNGESVTNGGDGHPIPVETPIVQQTTIAPAETPIVQQAPQQSFLMLQLSHSGRTKTVPFNFTSEQLVELIVQAELRDMRLTDFIATLLTRIIQHNLVDELLKDIPRK